jgi:hypothetical protein
MKQIEEHDKENELSALDRILSTEEELIPSSGFLASVMERVEDETRAPAPIRFPWKRAIPGFVLATGVFGWGGVVLVREAVSAVRTQTVMPVHLPAGLEQSFAALGWVGLALAISLVSWVLSRRIAGESGLL